MTETLYDTPYLCEFDAEVIAVTERGDGFGVMLDRTAFFPEAGGQTADTGTLDGLFVSDVRAGEQGPVHILSSPIPIGTRVHGNVDFARRFEKMQCHTGEHIVSGLIHATFGYDNVGFHLGEEIETLDISGVLTREDLDRIEDAANAVIYKSLPVTVSYPSAHDLASLAYRSKLDLTENVRIVTIPGVDTCACCAPHVSHTGEIGVIKLLDFEKHKGGVRVYMTAGGRALRDYRARYESVFKISTLLSAKQTECVEAVEKLNADLSAMTRRCKEISADKMRVLAEHFTPCGENAVLFLPDATYEDLRTFANAAVSRVPGVLVLLSGNAAAPIYVIASRTQDLKVGIRKIHESLPGRGGGSSCMVQGTFAVPTDAVTAYFDA